MKNTTDDKILFMFLILSYFVVLYAMGFIPFTDWAHNAHSVLFEQLKNAYHVSSLRQSVKGIRYSENPYNLTAGAGPGVVQVLTATHAVDAEGVGVGADGLLLAHSTQRHLLLYTDKHARIESESNLSESTNLYLFFCSSIYYIQVAQTEEYAIKKC